MSGVASEEMKDLKKLSEELNEKSSDMKKLDTTIDCQQAQFLIMLQEWKLLVRITFSHQLLQVKLLQASCCFFL